jgi:hypothetical protein
MVLAMALLACAGCESRAEPAPTQPAAPASAAITVATSASVAPPPKPPPEPWLTKTLRESGPEWKGWLERAEELRLQILVTVLEPSGDVATHELRADAEYFYPASAIKLPLAVVALSAMNERLGYPVPPMTRLMRCRYDRSGCEPPREDEDHERDKDEDGVYKHEKLRVGTELRKMLSYSDNDSYNRLWDIVGHREANEIAQKLGLSSVRFHHRMNAPADKSVSTQRVTLLPPGKKAVVIGKRKSDFELEPTPAAGLEIGKGYNAGGKLVEEPMSFASKNYVSLHELQRILLSLVRPQHPKALKLGLDDDQRKLLVKAMTARLRSKKHAAEHNPFSPGVLEVVDHDAVRYVGKSGRAYGFHLDNAYIEDPKSKRALVATAVVYVNPNQILNDDDYEYDETSKPLLASLGKVLTEKLLFTNAPPRKE